MPLAEPTILDLHRYSLRLIGPKAVVYPDTPGAQFTVLGRTDMVARPLPDANIPNSADFVSGEWTGRLFDAGDGKLTFPNKEASDGVPWRNRFDPTGKLQWVEVWLDEYLESVLCVTKVTPDRNQVVVEGYDGFQLCKTAYERDWTVVQAPRDVIERGTQLWMPVTADNFPASSSIAGGTLTTPTTAWTITTAFGGTVSVAPSGGVTLSVAGANDTAAITAPTTSVNATGTWRCSATIQSTTVAWPDYLALDVVEDSDTYEIQFSGTVVGFYVNSTKMGQLQFATPAPSYSLLLESDGEWVAAFVNGQLIMMIRRPHATTVHLHAKISLIQNPSPNCKATITNVLLAALQPFLQRGTDKGDYVLPGGPSTYPSGGLHARYFNNLDLQGDSDRLLKIHSPPRTQAYAGSGSSEYQNQQDATINSQANPLPGATTVGWSCIWFGAIYLKLSAGDYAFRVDIPGVVSNGTAVRAWIGKTTFGSQVLDQWVFTGVGGTTQYTFALTASTLAGAPPYGGTPVVRDGWYPIKIEYAADSGAPGLAAPVFRLTNSPAAYTDPGGTAIASGAQTTVVPATSLSPLGIVDQRYQGTSHYDLVQKTALAFGYQFSVEPKQLEDPAFPGVLAPRIREGADYDVTVEPDDTQRRGDAMINYSSTVDGTDQIASLQGNGAGFQNGTQGQLQGEVYDPATLAASLFDMQGWQDNADASFGSLLGALLGAELGLRLVPWSLVSGDPAGRPRQAQTWPLPGSVSNMRWRPGDGAKVWARDINVQDTSPRQMLLVTRQIHPNGVTATQVGWAGRPKSNAYANRQALAAAMRPQRNYQRQLVTLTGNFTNDNVAGGADGSASLLALLTGDLIVRARVRIVSNAGGVALNLKVNGVDQTTVLNGPWTVVPVNLDISAIATPSAGDVLYTQLHIPGGVASNPVQHQLLVDVLR